MIIFEDLTSPTKTTNVSSSKPLPVTIIGGGTGDVDGPASSTDNAIVRFDGTTGKLLQNSTVIMTDNGDISVPSTATAGLQLYNTADQTTNYERLEALWSSNVAVIRSVASGTGATRVLELRANLTGNANYNVIRTAGYNVTTFGFQFTASSATGFAGLTFIDATQTFTATSGQTNVLAIRPTYNQASGTAANTDLLINRTQTAVGSGTQRLIDAQVGGASQFSVSNNGTITTAGALITTPQALSGAGAVNVTTTTTEYTSTGGAQALTLANGTAGQIKTIIHVVDGGSGVLAPTTPLGYTNITFTNAGESATLQYTSAGWAILSLRGAVAA